MIRVLPGIEELSLEAAEIFAALARESLGSRGKFTVALPGGTTPGRLYEVLAADEYRLSIRWPEVHVFWGDERCVPPEDGRSNFRLANEALLRHVPAIAHRARGELGPELAAVRYEEEIRSFFGSGGSGLPPAFDLIILGVGSDGHTASLFPGSEAIRETGRLVTGVPGADPPRVSFTLPLINSARHVIFLAAGREKANVIGHIIGEGNKRGYPAGLVRPAQGEVTWLLDEEAWHVRG